MTTKEKARNGEPAPISGEDGEERSAEGQFVCKNCGKLDTIQEVYLGPIVETRRWDGECYELTYTNFDETTYRVVCPKCGAVLDEVEQG